MFPNGIKYYRERLRNEKKKDWSQEALARHLGVTRSRISMLENGHAIPTPDELEALAEYLEVTPGHLYDPDEIDLIFKLARKQKKGAKGDGDQGNKRSEKAAKTWQDKARYQATKRKRK